MPKLTWISDKDLTDTVASLLTTAQKAKHDAKVKFGKNVIDPFSAIFEMSGFNMTYSEWIKTEEARQAQKTLQNFIGNFHQDILGGCSGWLNMHVGEIIDLHNPKKQIIAEVKNKYNTVSGGKLSDLYYSLESAVMDKTSIYRGFTSYHVSIIPFRAIRYDIEFRPSDKQKGQKCSANKLIRTMDGASFYELVTGDKNSLKDLFSAIPDVIAEITQADKLDRKSLKSLFEKAYG